MPSSPPASVDGGSFPNGNAPLPVEADPRIDDPSSPLPQPRVTSGETATRTPPPRLRMSYRQAVGSPEREDPPDEGFSPRDRRVRPQGLLPTPEALEAVRRLYLDDQPDPSRIIESAKSAQPEPLPDTLFSISGRVSSSLFGVSRPALVVGLAAVSDNSVVRDLLAAGEIVQVHRQPRNTVVLYLRSEESKKRLAGQQCEFLGRTLKFDELNPLSDAFYLDVLGIQSDAMATLIFRGLLLSGCEPIYFNFTYRAPTGSVTSGIVRFYFNSTQCPEALIVGGAICDQIAAGGTLYSARARGAQAVQYYLLPHKFSEHALHFDMTGTPTTPSSPIPANHGEDSDPEQEPLILTLDSAGDTIMAPTSCGKRGRDDHSSGSVDTMGDNMDDTDNSNCSDLSLGRRSNNSGAPPSPTFQAPPRKKPTRPNSQHQVDNAPSFASPNYWEVLSSVEVDWSVQPVQLGGEDGTILVVPDRLHLPPSTRDSSEYTHVTELRRGIAKKSSSPITICETVKLLEQNMDNHLTLARREAEQAASTDELEPSRSELFATTSDDLTRSIQKSRVHFACKLFRLMRTKNALMQDFIRVHHISRAVCSARPFDCRSVADQWLALFGDKAPRSRASLFEAADRWMLDECDHDLYAISQALAFFELVFMCTIPALFEDDMWLRVTCGFDGGWIGASPIRFLHPNTLLSVLRSAPGAHVFSFIKSTGWTSPSVDMLSSLQVNSLWLPWDAGVLTIGETSVGPAWTTVAVNAAFA